MSTIILKPVQYPEEDILEFEQLTPTGLDDIRHQAQELLEDLEKGRYE